MTFGIDCRGGTEEHKAMPKRRRRKLSAGGPYLATAVLCEKVLQEKDGVASLIV